MPTYSYIDTAGKQQTVEASTPDLAIKTAPNRDKNSGVQLVQTPSNLGSKDATGFINANQDSDMAAAAKSDEPPVRNAASDLTEAFKSLTGKTSLMPTSALPSAPNFEQGFIDMRKQYGIAGIEESINNLDAEEQDLQAQLRISKNSELGKPVALGVIEGRVGEQERNFMERIDFVTRQKARAVNQLQTANDAIENIMTFRKMDYDVAKDRYDTEFTQNLALFDTVRGVAEFAATEREREQDSARANLQIIYNAVKDGNADLSTVDENTKLRVSKLELQAGLPQGFYASLQSTKPDAKILSTTTRTSGGKKYADIIYQNQDGSLTTQQVVLGATNEGAGGTPTESDLERTARAGIINYFGTKAGEDGKVAPSDYVSARKAWISDVKGATPSEFDEIFARDYLLPDNYDAAGVSLF